MAALKGKKPLSMLLALSAILLGLGMFAPRFGMATSDDRLRDPLDSVLTSFQLARDEAMRSGHEVVISAIDSRGGSWRAGWVIWSDRNGDGTLDSGEDIRVVKALTESAVLKSLAEKSRFSYAPSGLVDQAGELLLCDGAESRTGRRISITALGNLIVDECHCG